MAIAVSSLKPGDRVTVLFKGSKALGNEPYTLEDLEVQAVDLVAERITLADGCLPFDIYKFGSQWAYGSSAERLKVLARTRGC